MLGLAISDWWKLASLLTWECDIFCKERCDDDICICKYCSIMYSIRELVMLYKYLGTNTLPTN